MINKKHTTKPSTEFTSEEKLEIIEIAEKQIKDAIKLQQSTEECTNFLTKNDQNCSINIIKEIISKKKLAIKNFKKTGKIYYLNNDNTDNLYKLVIENNKKKKPEIQESDGLIEEIYGLKLENSIQELANLNTENLSPPKKKSEFLA